MSTSSDQIVDAGQDLVRRCGRLVSQVEAGEVAPAEARRDAERVVEAAEQLLQLVKDW